MRTELKGAGPGSRRVRALAQRALLAAAAVTSSAAMLIGCPGTLTETEKAQFQTTSGGAFQCPEITTLFTEKCGGMGCHSSMMPASGLDLTSAGVEDRVIDKAGMGCAGFLANTSDPTASLIYTKLLEQVPCGARMPFLRDPLSEDETNCVLAWLETLEGSGMPDAGAEDASDDAADAAMP